MFTAGSSHPPGFDLTVPQGGGLRPVAQKVLITAAKTEIEMRNCGKSERLFDFNWDRLSRISHRLFGMRDGRSWTVGWQSLGGNVVFNFCRKE